MDVEAEAEARAEAEMETAEISDSLGTGFVVSMDGDFLTNAHVVEKCSVIVVDIGGRTFVGKLIGADPTTDLALVRTDFAATSIAKFISRNVIPLGSRAVVVGYPPQGALATSANVTTGVVSSTAGLDDDFRLFQIMAPLQQGNSSGPVLNEYGLVVGIVVADIESLRVAVARGDLPQNVNFAIKSGVARRFAEQQSVEFQASRPGKEMSMEEVARLGKSITARILCQRT